METTSKTIKGLNTDGGGEYCSEYFHDYLVGNGIQHFVTAARTPKQNGISERLNRTLGEKARAMLLHANLPLFFWGEAISTAAFIRNRVVTKILKNKTPYEKKSGKKASVKHFKVFGCIAYNLLGEGKKDSKFDARGEKCRHFPWLH